MQQTSKENTVKEPSGIKQMSCIKEYLRESEFLKKARTSAESLKIPVIDDETGRFLELSCYLLKPLKILEIGCGTGYSTYFLLKYLLPQLASEELSDGKSRGRKAGSLSGGAGAAKSFSSADYMGSGKSGSISFVRSSDKLNNLAVEIGTALKSAGAAVNSGNSAKGKPYKSEKGKTDNSKKKFSYTGIDLNRERLKKACFFVSGLINKTITPGLDGQRIKTVIECETFCCSFEFIHGNAVKIIREEQETREKYDLVFIDAAKYQYPDYLEAARGKLNIGCAVIADNVFYCGKIFNEEISKHDRNSVAGLSRYLEIITGDGAFKTTLFNIGDGISFSLYNKDK